MGDSRDSRHVSKTVGPKTWPQWLEKHPEVKFVWLRSIPLHGGLLAYMVPIQQFSRMVQEGRRSSIGRGMFTHFGRDNVATPGFSFIESFYLEPDFGSVFHWSNSLSAAQAPRLEVFTTTLDEEGCRATECPRTTLQTLHELLSEKFQSTILLGFEVEVIFVRRNDSDLVNSLNSLTAVSDGHLYAGATTAMKSSMLVMVEDIVTRALQLGVEIDRFHAEMAPGQFEFNLEPQTPVQAVDKLMQFREVLKMVAHEHGFLATLHPQPFGGQMGSGLHSHISYNTTAVQKESAGDEQRKQAESFFAGVLDHFPAIVGFAAPLDVCFRRLELLELDDIYWGWNNRTSPLRRITSNRFEFRSMCGTANTYLVMASIVAAGIDGLHRDAQLSAGPCQVGSRDISKDQRVSMRIVAKIPKSIQQSMENLRADYGLATYLGHSLIDAYIETAVAYNQRVRDMDVLDQSRFLLETY